MTHSAVRWSAPDLSEPAPAANEPVIGLSAEEIESLRAQERDRGYREGFDQGLPKGMETGKTAGFASGESEVRKLTAQITGILDSFQRPLARLDHEVRDAILDVCVGICSALIGREYQHNPELMISVIQAAMDSVAGVERHVELRLHPDDIGLLNPFLAAQDARFTPDESLARGDLRLHTPSVRIDATLKTRLETCVARMLDEGGAA